MEADPRLDVSRWFLDHPIVEGGRTWVLKNSWGTNTEPTLTALAEAFPEAN